LKDINFMPFDRDLDCLADTGSAARPLWPVRPTGLNAFLAELNHAQAAYLRDAQFDASAGSLVLLPGTEGVAGAVLGLGEDDGPFVFGELPFALPEASVWALQPGSYDPAKATLGFCLGAYRAGKQHAPARLVRSDGDQVAAATAQAIWMVRDLINAPANRLGPAELAGAARHLAERYRAEFSLVEGEALRRAYPTVAAVGAGAARPPLVATFRWRGTGASAEAPLIALCGKGVCFDSGGYDIKPSSGMLRMKKDMGGAAIALGLARMIMAADLPVRLALRIGCVENSISGSAMRPLDVVDTRRGISVEIGNTDAEGRLVLCDLLAEASDEKPALLLDFATLTGAARVALGPDLPALFANDDTWADAMLAAGRKVHDPLWRLPLWAGYDRWLASTMADLNNVSSKPFAGAIVAALFLQRFLAPETPWMHVDVYAWNDTNQSGRPEGGEAQAMRAAFAAIAARFGGSTQASNMRLT
jgi:leucyl aminopeptidase